MIRLLSFALLAVLAAAGCTDVGRCRLGSEDCACAANHGCDEGLACVRTEDRCRPAAATICEESCFAEWNGDGSCDDGGEGSRFQACGLGSDCADCGARVNPCTDPAYPVFCTEVPIAPEGCWSAGTDCSTITYCEDDGTISGACSVGMTFDCATGACIPDPCVDPDFPVFCAFDDSCAANPASCCFGAHTDCRTATPCFGRWYACTGRLAGRPLAIDCGADADSVACINPW